MIKYIMLISNPKTWLRFFGIGVISLGLVGSLFIYDVLAVEYGGLGGRPAYPRADNPRTESIFVHTINPGEAVDEGVLVINNTPETKTLLVYATDSTPSTGGAFACAQKSVSSRGVGSWIELEQTEVTLASGEGGIIPFTISAPESASVGEHNGCIVMQEKIEEVAKKSGVNLSFRTGLRVAITVPGEIIRELEIVGFDVERREDGSFLLYPDVKNTGNVSIDADIQLITKNIFGVTHLEHGGQYPVFRGETLEQNFQLKKPFWGGWYRSSFFVEYDKNPGAGVGIKSGKELTRLQGPSVWFFSFPTGTALAIEIIILLGLASIGLLSGIAFKRKRWIKENWIVYEVKAKDDINSLADKFEVSWKLLVKVNKLQAPYALKKGDKIKVPPTK